jgi:hypothetical protein
VYVYIWIGDGFFTARAWGDDSVHVCICIIWIGDGFLTARAWGDDSNPASPVKVQLRSAFRTLLSSSSESERADVEPGSALSAVGEESGNTRSELYVYTYIYTHVSISCVHVRVRERERARARNN